MDKPKDFSNDLAALEEGTQVTDILAALKQAKRMPTTNAAAAPEERRWRAITKAGLDKVTCIFIDREMTESEIRAAKKSTVMGKIAFSMMRAR